MGSHRIRGRTRPDTLPAGSDADRVARALPAVAAHLAAGLNPEEVCTRVLATLAGALGWSFAAVWRPDADSGVLRCAALWHDPTADNSVAAFAQASRRFEFGHGEGVPGRTWASRRVAWIPDVGCDTNLPRLTHAIRARLISAVAFPVGVGERCVGVLEFFSTDMKEPGDDLVRQFAVVGDQLAEALERHRHKEDERRRVEGMLRTERDRAQRYLDVAGTMIVVLDREGRVTLINRKGCAVLGRDEAQVVGADWFELAVPDHERGAVRSTFRQLMAGEVTPVEEYENSVVTRTGSLRTVLWHNTVLRDSEGRVSGTLSSGEDVTERHAAEQQITYLAYHDQLTGLANRTLLEEHLALALARSRRTGSAVALLQLDVDNFKLVNDSLGHAAGDALIGQLVTRLQASVRATDLLARTGGDGFILLLADLHEDAATTAEHVAGQVVECLDDAFLVAGVEFQVSASIGIALYPRDAHGAEDLLAHADSAMYQAKDVARGSWANYAQAGHDPLARLSLAARLRRALQAREFQLHYQPIFTAAGMLVGVEALLRWHDAERGEMVPPSEFIPVAEETGLIESIGDWVIGAACAQQVTWKEAGVSLQVSVNVSPRQLRRTDFIESVRRHLQATGADPRRMTIELTESAMLQDPSEAEAILHELRALGLELALDDFGAGYSSLSRLREMPMETLKIDRAFLREVPDSHEASAIITAILALARALGRSTVAEGVETEEQRRFLEEQECPLLQGFLLGRPMPAAHVQALVLAGQRIAA